MSGQGRRILFATTVPESAVFLEPLYGDLADRSHVYLLFGKDGAVPGGLEARATVLAVDMARTFSPVRDLRALFQIVHAIASNKIDTVVCGTPKAGLLVSIAAALMRVPRKIFILHGLRHETLRGPLRFVMWLSDAIACRLTDVTVAVSPSLCQEALSAHIAVAGKVVVFGAGSVCGIDPQKYRPASSFEEREASRRELCIEPGDIAIGYVGRLANDKGISELIRAHEILERDGVRHRLVMVGGADDSDPLSDDAERRLKSSNISMVGRRSDIPVLLRGFDVLALPTYREGLGLVALEASATGLPVVATDVTGMRDAVRDGETGYLVPSRDAESLAAAIAKLLHDPTLRGSLGARGREFVLTNFAPAERVNGWQALLELDGGYE